MLFRSRLGWRKFLLIWTATSYRPVLHQGQLFIAVCCGKNCNGLIHGKLAGFNFLQSTFHIGRYHDLLCNNDSLLNGSKNIAALQLISHLRNRNEIPFFVPLQGRNLNASFQVEASGFEHQAQMPVGITPPELLKSELELVRPYEQMIPATLRDKILCEQPIEIRPVTLVDPIRPAIEAPLRHVWFKANGQIPDDQRVHNYLLAYASDFNFLLTALQPHGVSYWEPDMQVATIDHSMWFHREFRLDDWLLYVVDSPSASGGRGQIGRASCRERVSSPV